MSMYKSVVMEVLDLYAEGFDPEYISIFYELPYDTVMEIINTYEPEEASSERS